MNAYYLYKMLHLINYVKCLEKIKVFSYNKIKKILAKSINIKNIKKPLIKIKKKKYINK